jgi:hypothetical protein
MAENRPPLLQFSVNQITALANGSMMIAEETRTSEIDTTAALPETSKDAVPKKKRRNKKKSVPPLVPSEESKANDHELIAAPCAKRLADPEPEQNDESKKQPMQPHLKHFLCIPLCRSASRPTLEVSVDRFRKELQQMDMNAAEDATTSSTVSGSKASSRSTPDTSSGNYR